MLFDLVDYSKKYGILDTFVDDYLSYVSHSAIYGEYEYEINGVFSHYYKEIKVVRASNSDSYSGFADQSGFVTLHKDSGTYTVEFDVFRRDRISLNDEILRYADYCRFCVICLRNYCDGQLKHREQTGRIDNASIPSIRNDLEKINFKKLDKDPIYAIKSRKAVLKHYETLGYHHPWSSSKYVYYQFFSTIKCEEEKQIEEEYKKSKKKDELNYIKRKEEAHFKYLESKLSDIKLNFDNQVVLYYDLTKRERFLRFVSLVASILLFLALFGLPAAIKEVHPDATFTTYLLYYSGTLGLLALPLIYFILKTIKRRNFKRAKKFQNK